MNQAKKDTIPLICAITAMPDLATRRAQVAVMADTKEWAGNPIHLDLIWDQVYYLNRPAPRCTLTDSRSFPAKGNN